MMFLVQSPVKYKNNINCLLKHLVSLLDVHIVFFLFLSLSLPCLYRMWFFNTHTHIHYQKYILYVWVCSYCEL